MGLHLLVRGAAGYFPWKAADRADLASLLEREGQLAVPRAVSLLLQAARGVAKAHALGVVHRDVKPKNLFVLRRDDGLESCKVLDFGVAKLTDPTSGFYQDRRHDRHPGIHGSRASPR